MAVRLDEIVRELENMLEPDRFADYCRNGLQVPGGEDVEVIATGVSASVELFEGARARNANVILVHHGLFWGAGVGAIDRALARRLRVLFEAEIALLAYHLPLDAHGEVGNNALLAKALGAERTTPFADHRGERIGCLAELPHGGVEARELVRRVAEVTAREPLVFECGPAVVRRVGIVSGGGSDYLGEAIAGGADAFITGEPTERVMTQAREGGVHFIAAGHYATETFGVRRVGELLAERFGIRHVFIDVPNPI